MAMSIEDSKTFTISAKPMPALEIVRMLKAGGPAIDRYLGEEIYANSQPDYIAAQRKRLAEVAKFHAERVGNRPTFLIRAPGRLNAFLEYLDMCAGDHMSTTIDGDVPACVSPREDNTLNLANINPLFPPEELSISAEFRRFADEPLCRHARMADNWDNRTLVIPHFGRPQGKWTNYVISPYLRVMWDSPSLELKGADISFGRATAPFRAGTSSSSAVVVLSFLALYLSNRDRLPSWEVPEICKMLGEAEWYVGTHGGANDQTTILRNMPNCVLYNRHSRTPLESTPLPFLRGVHVVLANSLWEVNKSLTGNQSFNMRKGWMELGDELMKLIIAEVKDARNQGKAHGSGWLSNLIKKRFGFEVENEPHLLETHPEYWDKIEANYHKFGSLDENILGIPNAAIEELILLLPVKITPDEAARILGKDRETIEQLYTKPKRSIGGYHTRTTARFFYKENIIGRKLEKIFLEAENRLKRGELTVDSPEYDRYRVMVGELVEQLQHILAFDFRVSNSQLDRLINIARRGPGYLGSKLTGAGKGGCVSILVRENQSQAMCEYLDEEYYGKRENFEEYRQILQDVLRYYEPDSFERASAIEQLENLENALASIKDQRRVVTFSRGACVVDLEALG